MGRPLVACFSRRLNSKTLLLNSFCFNDRWKFLWREIILLGPSRPGNLTTPRVVCLARGDQIGLRSPSALSALGCYDLLERQLPLFPTLLKDSKFRADPEMVIWEWRVATHEEKKSWSRHWQFSRPVGFVCSSIRRKPRAHEGIPACIDKTLCPVTVHNLRVPTPSVQYLAPPAALLTSARLQRRVKNLCQTECAPYKEQWYSAC